MRLLVVATFTLAVLMNLHAAEEVPRAQIQTPHTSKITSIDVDPTGSYCLTSSNDYTMRLWSLDRDTRGALLQVLAGHSGAVLGGVFNPNDPRQCVSWSQDGTVRLWQIVSGSSVVIVCPDVPTAVDVRNGTNVVAVAAKDRTLSFYDGNTGRVIDRPYVLPFVPTCVRFSPSGDDILVCGDNGAVQVINVRSQQVVVSTRLASSPIIGASWLSSDRWVAFAKSGEHTAGTIKEAFQPRSLSLRLRSVARARLNNAMVVLAEDGSIHSVEYDGATTRSIAGMKSVLASQSLGLDYYGNVIVGIESSGGRHSLAILRWNGEGEVLGDALHTPIITGLCQLQNSRDVLVGNNLGEVWLWASTQDMRPVRLSNGEFKKVEKIVENPRGTACIVAGFGAANLGLFDARTREFKLFSLENVNRIRDVSFLANDRIIVVDDEAGDIVVADTQGSVRVRIPANCRFIFALDSVTLIGVGDSSIDCYALQPARVVSRLVAQLATSELTIGAEYHVASGMLIVAKGNGTVYAVRLQRTLESITAESLPAAVSRRTSITAMARTVDGIVVASGEGVVRLLRASLRMDELGEVSRTQLQGRPTALFASRASDVVLVGMQDGTVHLLHGESLESRASFLATETEWLVVSANARYDGESTTKSPVLVVHDLQARSLEQMPIAMKQERLFFLVLSEAATTDTPSSSIVSASYWKEMPASARFVKRSMQTSTSGQVLLTYQLAVHSQNVQRVYITEGARIVHDARAYQSYGLQSGLQTLRVDLRPGRNDFVLRAVTFDDRVSTDTLSVNWTSDAEAGSVLHAVLIGVDKYLGRFEDLRFASADVRKVEYSIKQIDSGSRRIQLVNERAKASHVLRELRRIAFIAKPGDNLIVFFAGHGKYCRHSAEVASYCLIPYCEPSCQREDQELPLDSVLAIMETTRASGMMLILDACQSGALAESERLQSAFAIAQSRGTTIAVIASTTKSALAAEVPQLGGGILSHLVAEGINGAARDQDGEVTAFSLANFVGKRMPALCATNGVPTQQPVVRLGSTGSTMVISRKK